MENNIKVTESIADDIEKVLQFVRDNSEVSIIEAFSAADRIESFLATYRDDV